MPTVVLNAYSKAYPTITNRIRASVYLQTDPQALIASIIDATAGHPARTWSFPGLPRTNYGFTLDEIDGVGTPINNLATFDVVPGEIDGMLVRGDEQIQVGITTGFITGATSFTFDGTSGKPNYIGWEIVPSELTGRGILVRGVDYSWDKTTGTFSLLQVGDVFASLNWYNIHFDPILNPAGNSYPSVNDFEINYLDVDTSIDSSYFGHKLIVEPSSDLVKIYLPNILTVPQGRRMFVEITGSGNLNCVEFDTIDGSTINFLRGNLHAYSSESFSIYKWKNPFSGTFEWRVCESFGNFNNCGTVVSHDQIQLGLINFLKLDGSSVSRRRYARLYEDIVLNLPSLQVCNYDDWGTVYPVTFYSLANSANPLNVDLFHIPDRRNLFERSTSGSSVAGTYSEDSIKYHKHKIPSTKPLFPPFGGDLGGAISQPGFNTVVSGSSSYSSNPIDDSGISVGDTETKPKNYLINKYVLI